jgi:hypothetical protein
MAIGFIVSRGNGYSTPLPLPTKLEMFCCKMESDAANIAESIL